MCFIKMGLIEINHVNYGIANTFKDRIEINKALLQKPQLYELVLNHELKHANKEIHVDAKEKWNNEMMLFILLHPSTWVQFLPIWYMNRTIIYDKSMCIMWGLALNVILLVVVASIFPHLGLLFAGILVMEGGIILKWLV